MTKGTTSMGGRSSGKTHIRCRRCGRHSFHTRKKRCAFCGFNATPKIRFFSWMHYRKNH